MLNANVMGGRVFESGKRECRELRRRQHCDAMMVDENDDEMDSVRMYAMRSGVTACWWRCGGWDLCICLFRDYDSVVVR